MTSSNDFGQPIGPDLGGWQAPPVPPARVLTGDHVTLTPLNPAAHGADLMAAFADAPDSLWTYMPFGPFADDGALASTLDKLLGYPDWLVYAATVAETAVGFLAYLRIDAKAGVVEIGSIAFSPRLQRTTAATEAIYLMLENAFALGYRRCEWKCDSLNGPSRSAAVRFGFQYEGTFRNATYYKDRSRDTAWYAITAEDWPRLAPAYRRWLAPGNFDDNGIQRRPLGDMCDDVSHSEDDTVIAPRPREFPDRGTSLAQAVGDFLEFVQTTSVNKIAGLTEIQARATPLSTSPAMSLLGLIKHQTAVLRQHIQIHIGGQDLPSLWRSDDQDYEFRLNDDDSIESVIAAFDRECAASGETLASVAMDAEIVTYGHPNRVGRVLADVLQESARHLGHMDILREMIDGAKGE